MMSLLLLCVAFIISSTADAFVVHPLSSRVRVIRKGSLSAARISDDTKMETKGEDDTGSTPDDTTTVAVEPNETKHAVSTTPVAVAAEDTSGLFRHSVDSGYIPAGLTEDEWKLLKEEEKEELSNKDYGAWGPRFRRADGPVANDMAWMVDPGLWTGETDPLEEQEDDDDDGFDMEAPLPLHDGPEFLRNAKPWAHATKSDSSWQTTYERFCQGDSVHQMVADAALDGDNDDNDNDTMMDKDTKSFLKTCRLVKDILEGVTHHGGVALTIGNNNNDERVDLSPIAHYCVPNYADWSAMKQAEEEILQVDITSAPDMTNKDDELLLSGKTSRSDFLKAILSVRTSPDEESDDDDDNLEYSDADFAEMYMCMDWYIALRRIGISTPLDEEEEMGTTTVQE